MKNLHLGRWRAHINFSLSHYATLAFLFHQPQKREKEKESFGLPIWSRQKLWFHLAESHPREVVVGSRLGRQSGIYGARMVVAL